MDQAAKFEGWLGELDANHYGVRILTLDTAVAMAGGGSCAGWYVSPFALKWTIGRMASDRRRYHVIENGEPLIFDSVAEAIDFAGRVLGVSSTPAVYLALPQSARVSLHAA